MLVTIAFTPCYAHGEKIARCRDCEPDTRIHIILAFDCNACRWTFKVEGEPESGEPVVKPDG